MSALGIGIRFTQPFTLRFAQPTPRNTQKYLGFSNQWGAFIIGYHCSDKGMSSHEESVIAVEHIETAIKRARWMDRRQKGRFIRKARRIASMLVPSETAKEE